MNKEKFKKAVYEKYEKQLQNGEDTFFHNKIIVKNNYNFKQNFLKIIASIITTITTTAGIAYAGIATYNYYQEKTKMNFETNYNYTNDMENKDGVYYKKIKSFDEYSKIKESLNDVELTNEDFKDNMVLIVMTENGSLAGLNLNDIKNENEDLIIELFQDKSNIEENTLIIKIPFEKDRENIKFQIISKQPTSEKYTDLKELKKSYSKEEALADKCFVLENDKIISSDKEQLKKFVDNTNNGFDDFIRIANVQNNKLKIIDIQYKENKYYVCIDNTRIVEESDLKYISGIKMMLVQLINTDLVHVILQDEFCNQFPICVFI